LLSFPLPKKIGSAIVDARSNYSEWRYSRPNDAIRALAEGVGPSPEAAPLPRP
jgi:hypothetical protein